MCTLISNTQDGKIPLRSERMQVEIMNTPMNHKKAMPANGKIFRARLTDPQLAESQSPES